MNIFFVDKSPERAAMSLVDRHVVKMILETAQLLSTAHRLLDGKKTTHRRSLARRTLTKWTLENDVLNATLYQATHVNHPSAVWVRESLDNYLWAWDHLHYLLTEYTYRFGKTHKTEDILWSLMDIPYNIKEIGFTEPPQCMPDEYKVPGDTITAYRNYYKNGKAHLHKWTNREPPKWI
jgi:hypothetical protein